MKRPLCVFGAGFLTTMAVAFVCPEAAAPLLTATACTGIIRSKNRRITCVLLIAGMAALARMGAENRRLEQLELLAGEPMTATGYVCRTSPWDASRLLLRVRLPEGQSCGMWLDTGSQDWLAGDWLEVPVTVTGVQEDTQNFFYTGGWTLSASPTQTPRAVSAQWFSLPARMAAVREELLHQVRLHGADSGTELVMGLLFSADEGLPDSDRRAMERSGISHLLSVSGFHMSVVLAWAALRMPRSGLRKGMRLLICLGLVALVLALAGYGAAAMRAGILGVMTVLAGCIRRESDPWTSLTFSALILAMVSPMLMTDIGVQLSFCTTAGIFALSSPFTNLWDEWSIRLIGSRCRTFRTRLCSCLGMLTAAQISAAPVLAVRLGTVPLLSVLANLLVLPLVYGAMALGAAGVLLVMTPLAGISELLLHLASFCGNGILVIARVLSRLPGCTLSMAYPGRFLLLGLLLFVPFIPLLPVFRITKRKILFLLSAFLLLFQSFLGLSLNGKVQLLVFPESGSFLLYEGGREIVVSGAEELWQLRMLEEDLMDAGIVQPDVLICGRGGSDLILESARTISPACLAAPRDDLTRVERLIPTAVRTVELGERALPVHGVFISQFDGDVIQLEMDQTKVLKCWGGYAIMDFNLLLRGTQEGALVADREGRLWLRPGMISLPRPAGITWVLAEPV